MNSRYKTEAALENSRRASREAKRRRTGTCAGCGGPTRYHGRGKSVAEWCAKCNGPRTAYGMRGTGDVQAIVLDLLAQGPAQFVQIVEAGVPRNQIGGLLGRLMAHGLIVRVSRGLYALPPGTNKTPRRPRRPGGLACHSQEG